MRAAHSRDSPRLVQLRTQHDPGRNDQHLGADSGAQHRGLVINCDPATLDSSKPILVPLASVTEPSNHRLGLVPFCPDRPGHPTLPRGTVRPPAWAPVRLRAVERPTCPAVVVPGAYRAVVVLGGCGAGRSEGAARHEGAPGWTVARHEGAFGGWLPDVRGPFGGRSGRRERASGGWWPVRLCRSRADGGLSRRSGRSPGSAGHRPRDDEHPSVRQRCSDLIDDPGWTPCHLRCGGAVCCPYR